MNRHANYLVFVPWTSPDMLCQGSRPSEAVLFDPCLALVFCVLVIYWVTRASLTMEMILPVVAGLRLSHIFPSFAS